MFLSKEKGGCSIRPHRGPEYSWPEDGSVAEVPDHLGRELLAIPDGGYAEVDPPKKPTAKAADTPKAAASPAAKA